MTRRTLVYIGIGALAGVIAAIGGIASLRSSSTSAPGSPSAAGSVAAPAPFEADSAAGSGSVPIPIPTSTTTPVPIRRPASAVVELGVLGARPERALQVIGDRDGLAAAVSPELCGDQAACDAVRMTLRDAGATTLQSLGASAWDLDKLDLEVSGRGLSAAQHAAARGSSDVLVIRVTSPVGPEQLALRAAVAGAAVIARKTGGVVWDRLLGRVEPAGAFAAHAVTEALGRPVFRRDRLEVLQQPSRPGVVRMVTAGMSRFGAPEVEAAAVPAAAAPRLAELLLAVGEAIANGATTGPLDLSRDDLARARGEPYPQDPQMPEVKPVEVDVVPVHPESADPADSLLRVEPPGGDGPIGYVDLAERFFGPLLARAGMDALDGRRGRAQARLGAALQQWEAARAGGAKLLVLLPFAIPGDAGTESVWVDVTRFDARSVTGKVMDDPLGATEVRRGDEVTRPRAQVEDVDLRGAGP